MNSENNVREIIVNPEILLVELIVHATVVRQVFIISPHSNLELDNFFDNH